MDWYQEECQRRILQGEKWVVLTQDTLIHANGHRVIFYDGCWLTKPPEGLVDLYLTQDTVVFSLNYHAWVAK